MKPIKDIDSNNSVSLPETIEDKVNYPDLRFAQKSGLLASTTTAWLVTLRYCQYYMMSTSVIFGQSLAYMFYTDFSIRKPSSFMLMAAFWSLLIVRPQSQLIILMRRSFISL